MKNIVFYNSSAIRCGVGQYGRDTFEVLKESTKYDFYFSQAGEIPIHIHEPDAIIVNQYHDHKSEFRFPFEVPANCPVILINHADMTQEGADALKPIKPFTHFVIPNPIITTNGRYVFSITRLVQWYSSIHSYGSRHYISRIPRIGTFGFATHTKKWEQLCELVNLNFDRAILRVSCPPNDVVDPNGLGAKEAFERITHSIKPGIIVEFNNSWMTNAQLMRWLNENWLNVFLYTADQKGISSAIDQALAVDVPIAVNRVPSFEHLKICHFSPFVEDYPPETCLRTIMEMKNSTNALSYVWNPNVFLDGWEQIMDRIFHVKA